MGISGSLSTVGLPDILQLLSSGSKTGTLEIRKKNVVCRLFFQEGNIVYATCDSRKESILDILIREKHLTPEQVRRVQEKARGSDISIERALKETGTISDETLMQAALKQSKEIIYELFQWLDGTFVFHEGMLPADDIKALSVSIGTYNLIMEGARRIDEWSRIRKAIPNMDVIFSLEDDPQSGRIQFTKDEWRILALIDGRRSVRDLCRESGKSEFEVCRILYGLKAAGIIRELPSMVHVSSDIYIKQSKTWKMIPVVIAGIIGLLGIIGFIFFSKLKTVSTITKPAQATFTSAPVLIPNTPTTISESNPTPVLVSPSPGFQPSVITTSHPETHRIDINTASEEDLISLPRVGPATARRIIAYREANGPFLSAHDITRVPGIGEKTFNRLADKIKVGKNLHPEANPSSLESAAGARTGRPQQTRRININTADKETLISLPGIGPGKAARIIEYRDKNGPFTSVHQITEVKGIGEKTFEKLKPFIYVD